MTLHKDTDHEDDQTITILQNSERENLVENNSDDDEEEAVVQVKGSDLDMENEDQHSSVQEQNSSVNDVPNEEEDQSSGNRANG